MMTRVRAGLRVASLFVAYGTLGAGGDFAASLLAEDGGPRGVPAHIEADVAAEVERDLEHAPAVRLRARDADCAYELERRISLPAGDAELLGILAGSGELAVEGRAGLEDVEVVGRVCASHEEYLEDLQVTLEQAGTEIVLTAHYPESRSGRGRNTARIDLLVGVPLGMPVDIDDSSGSIETFGTGALRIDDSSGSVRVVGTSGSVRIDDSSGELEVRDAAGDVEVSDGSGEIEIGDVQGSVRVRDGSGGIDVTEVDRDVIIEDDGSGGIEVRNVGGAFVVEDDGSGGIRYSDVAGRVDIPADARRRGGR